MDTTTYSLSRKETDGYLGNRPPRRDHRGGPVPDPGLLHAEVCVGGSGGAEFCEYGDSKSGKLIKTLIVWKDKDQRNGYLRGIKVLFTDGSSRMFGMSAGESAQITLAINERVVALTLWGNGIGTRTGRIKIVTDRGQVFDWGKDTTNQDSYSAPVGSGLLIGIWGRHGSDIDNLSLIFLKAVRSVTMTKVDYKAPLSGNTGISPVTVGEATYHNNTSDSMQWVFRNAVRRVTLNEWGKSNATQFGVEVNVNATVWEIVGVGGGFEWSKTTETTHRQSESLEVELAWEASGTLAPGKSVKAKAVCRTGVGTVAYDAVVTIVLEGSTDPFVYNTSGVFQNVCYTSVDVTTEPALPGRQDHLN